MDFKYIVCFLTYLISMVVAQDAGSNGASGGTDPLAFLTNPKLVAALSAAEKLKKLIHSSSSDHITKREKTAGFEFLNIYANAQRSRGLPKRFLERVIKRSLKPFAAKSEKPEIREVVEDFELYVKSGEVEEEANQFFGIVSEKGNGQTHAIFVHFVKREDGKYNFKKVLFRGRFRLAADMVITRVSKSGFFSSSSRDVIKYLPRRGITDSDIKSLLNLIVPKIAHVINEFVPQDN